MYRQRCSFAFISILMLEYFAIGYEAPEESMDSLSSIAHDSQSQVPECPLAASAGWSLLQASSRMSTASWEKSSMQAAASSSFLPDFNDVRMRVGVLVLLSAIAILVFFKLYSDSKIQSVEWDEETLAVLGIEDCCDSIYGNVHPDESESDSGDFQIDDIIGGHATTDMSSFVPMVQRNPMEVSERNEYDPDSVRRHIEETYGSWHLLKSICGALLEFWAALAFMYWSLLMRGSELMDCSAYPMDRPNSFLVRGTCFYTLACLRGFPILAANMVLVLMIRIIVQTRLYYSMLRDGYVLHFKSAPILRTVWPWACGVSMLQGGLHFALKAYFAPDQVEGSEMVYVRIVRKFVLPGTIFFAFLLRYANIENTLVPLNRICEQDLTKDKRDCPWLSTVKVLSERVLAFDARHRDVIGQTEAKLGQPATINDIVQNMLENYDYAHKFWSRRKHRDWGLFRSMWPAAVLVDVRLDRTDPETRAWLTVFAIMVSGCAIVCLGSLYLLFFRMLFLDVAIKAVLIADAAIVFHGLLILMFIYRTIQNMFYYTMNSRPKKRKSLTTQGSSQAFSEAARRAAESQALSES